MQDTFSVPLVKREEVAEGTMAFFFTRPAEFLFTAGQYADFTLVDPPQTDAEGNTRTFSLPSSPSDREHLMITTRMRNTAFKNSLKTIPLGTAVTVSQPMGSFTLHKNAEKPALFLVGGIGITPIRSIVVDALERALPHQLFLFYSNRTPASTAFLAELTALAAQHPNFHFIPTITDPPAQLSPYESWAGERGRIDEAMITRHMPDVKDAIAYIVGPPAMVSGLIPVAERAGVDPDNIRTEEFAGY